MPNLGPMGTEKIVLIETQLLRINESVVEYVAFVRTSVVGVSADKFRKIGSLPAAENEAAIKALTAIKKWGEESAHAVFRMYYEKSAHEKMQTVEEIYSRYGLDPKILAASAPLPTPLPTPMAASSQQPQVQSTPSVEPMQTAAVPPKIQDPTIHPGGNRKALLIGNGAYKYIESLKNAKADAQALAQELQRVGYKVTTLLDLGERGMRQALRDFKNQVQGGDEVLIFFAGHGVQIGATNYLLPVDIRGESEEQIKDESIQLQRILDDMQEQRARFTLAMIDACRNNPFKVVGRAIGGRGLAPTTAATGQMVIFSAGAGQQALDSLGRNDKNPNSIFTRTFLREMTIPGQTVDRVVRNVRNQVVELAKSVGHEQVPALYDQVIGDFYFVR